VIGRTLGSAYAGHVVVFLIEATFGKVVVLVVSVVIGCIQTVFG
jgi:hypothetical protein